MPAWLFQTVDKRRIALIERGYVERWCVRRYRHEINKDNLVFMWLGGPPSVRGLYGWGRCVGTPYSDPEDQTAHVDVCYEQRVTPFLPAIALRTHPILHTLPILHMPRATNFRLEDVHTAALANMLNMPMTK